MSGHYPYAQSPAGERLPVSPRRRHPIGQAPSLLTTTLGNSHISNHGRVASIQTPASATSLSSPFSYPASPGGAMRGTSPMALRNPAGFNAAYNPQEWAPLNSNPSGNNRPSAGSSRQLSRTSRLAPRPVGPDEPIASPPPPYSPRREGTNGDTQRASTHIASPADTVSPDTDPSRYSTPVSAATTISPEFAPSSYRRSPLPPSQSFTTESPTVAQEIILPPPPSTANPNQRARSSSRAHTDRLLSSLMSKNRSTSSVVPIATIGALQQSTAHAISNSSDGSRMNAAVMPPATRRAASAGVIGLHGPSSRSSSRSPSQISWEPGMPLPPPPSGPPPPNLTRSQSLNRSLASESSTLESAAPPLASRSQRVPGSISTLGPVPPTPADWREEDQTTCQGTCAAQSDGPSPLHVDTGDVLRRAYLNLDEVTSAVSGRAPQHQSPHARRDSSTGALARSPAVRNRSAKGIRERRSESRNCKARVTESSNEELLSHPSGGVTSQQNVRPTDLVLPSSGTISRRRTSTRSPRSGKSMVSVDEAFNEIEASLLSAKHPTREAQDSSHSTPQPRSARLPQQISHHNVSSTSRTYQLSPPGSYLSPSDRLSTTSDSQPGNDRIDHPASTWRTPSEEPPISHLLHTANIDDSIQAPLVPLMSPPHAVQDDLLGPESPTAFSQRAVERHRRFAERESAAANNSERLDLFIQFMLAESRIRRERYAAVFEEENIDIVGMMSRLFTLRKPEGTEATRPSQSNQRPKGNESMHASTASDSSAQGSLWQVDSNVGSRKHESPITASSGNSPQIRPESNWWKDYIPSLSPIASMSIVTGQDEMDSRGRAPSRWFEDPFGGASAHGDAFSVLGRSRRESKYMGVPREARNSPALFESKVAETRNVPGEQHWVADPTAPCGSEEYPAEKVGWHEKALFPPNPPVTLQPTPYTCEPRKLDISRLVTLPPPYPRHHPAVNNNHPDLSDERAVVRSLQDFSESNEIREAFQSKIAEKRRRAEAWCKHQQSLHEQDIQFKVEHCEISPGGFDQAESEIERKISQSEKELAQADFDLFQSLVLSPLHAMFAERIDRATSSLEKLSGRLFTDAQQQSPNLPQEEGDDHAELLEKLTQLKWLFEARENLHRATYDLLSDRNDKYRIIVLLPYRQSKNQEKLVEAESFFAKDSHDRRLAFEQAVVSRSEAFLAVVETNVTRGVEIQLSAFWDIAPSLLQLLHKIPHHLIDFEIQIPADEYAENPRYHEHPMQYLYSLLTHAEKSTYQFIESQINLLCLLHEIRSLALAARYRVEESITGENEWVNRTALGREREERVLMDDLKEKVAIVEGQWVEGLGSRMGAERTRIREFLEDTGGWDDEADLA